MSHVLQTTGWSHVDRPMQLQMDWKGVRPCSTKHRAVHNYVCVQVYANCDMTGVHSASCLVSEPCPQKSTQTDRHTQIMWSGGILGVYQLTGG